MEKYSYIVIYPRDKSGNIDQDTYIKLENASPIVNWIKQHFDGRVLYGCSEEIYDRGVVFDRFVSNGAEYTFSRGKLTELLEDCRHVLLLKDYPESIPDNLSPLADFDGKPSYVDEQYWIAMFDIAASLENF